MTPAAVRLRPLDTARLPLFARLWQFYLYEASARDALALDASGQFEWDDELFAGIAHGGGRDADGARAWLLECDGDTAGLLVTLDVRLAGAPIREFADLYVLPRWRGRGVASAVIRRVMIDGDSPDPQPRWRVAVFRNDPAALDFWQRASARLPLAGWREVDPPEIAGFHEFVFDRPAGGPHRQD